MAEKGKKFDLDKAVAGLEKAREAAEIGKAVAPPGVSGRIQDAEDAIEIAEAGIGLFARLKKLFKRK